MSQIGGSRNIAGIPLISAIYSKHRGLFYQSYLFLFNYKYSSSKGKKKGGGKIKYSLFQASSCGYYGLLLSDYTLTYFIFSTQCKELYFSFQAHP